LNAKAEVGSFKPAYLTRSLEARQVPLTKRLLLWLGLTPSASQFQSARLMYGLTWPDEAARDLGCSVLDILEALTKLQKEGRAIEAEDIHSEADARNPKC